MKNIFAKLFGITVLTGLALFSWGFAPVNEEYEQPVIVVCDETFARNLERGKALVDETLERYRTLTRNGLVYDDQFAGIWFCGDGHLNIGITNQLQNITRNSYVIYHVREFSYNFLNDMHSVITNLMPRYSIWGSATTSRYNRVEISFSNIEYKARIINHLERYSLFEENAILFIEAERGFVMPDPHLVVPPPIINPPVRDIRAGQQVSHSIINFGSIGAKAVCNRTGRRGILTNEHVIPANTRLMHGSRYTNLINPMPIGIRAQAQIGGKVDAAFVPFDNPNHWYFTSSASYGNTVIPRTYMSNRNSIIEGLPVVKFGATTGRTYGIIQNTDVSFISTDDRQFTNKINHNAFALRGDSGGPLFLVGGHGRHILLGINSHVLGASTMASNIHNVIEALDITIVSEGEVLNLIDDYQTQYLPVAGSEILFQHNYASFMVEMFANDGSIKSFSFSGDGERTTISSPSWGNGFLNDKYLFIRGRLVFYEDRFRINATISETEAFHQTFFGNPGARFTFMRIVSTTMSEWSVISGPLAHTIHTAEELNNIRNNLNGVFILGDNIDLRGFEQWNPIANFRGILDGNGFFISNMHINRVGANWSSHVFLGLFANLGGTVRNLGICSSTITVTNNQNGVGWVCAGFIAGTLEPNGRVEDVIIVDTNYLSVYRHRSQIGMVVGYSYGTITGNWVIGARLSGNGDMGGIVGGMYGGVVEGNVVNWLTISHTHNNTNRGVGGIVGYQNRGSVINNRVDRGGISWMNTGGPFIGTISGRSRNGAFDGNSASSINLTTRDPRGQFSSYTRPLVVQRGLIG
ncbi:MAG: hypothetical protein FWE45_01790 [Firmicutes bacterium]|nr:hypothetical protein [Bacillota bacterium]